MMIKLIRQAFLIKKLARVRAWIDPPDFARIYEGHCKARQAGTSQWLFQEAMFEHWRESQTQSTGTVRRFQESAIHVSGTYCATFICRVHLLT